MPGMMSSSLTPGTGKTATFAVSILQKIDVQLAECQALVLAPTRELAQQIVKVVRALGDYMQLQVSFPSRVRSSCLVHVLTLV